MVTLSETEPSLLRLMVLLLLLLLLARTMITFLLLKHGKLLMRNAWQELGVGQLGVRSIGQVGVKRKAGWS